MPPAGKSARPCTSNSPAGTRTRTASPNGTSCPPPPARTCVRWKNWRAARWPSCPRGRIATRTSCCAIPSRNDSRRVHRVRGQALGVDLKSGYPFWAVKNGLMTAFPPLREDVRCDVAIVGGGITAALIARELAAHGHDVCVVEQRDIAWGSTAASTALLQYEIDVHLVDLSKQYGEDDGALAYRACASAIDQLQDVARAVRDVGFARCDSLYYASRPWHVRRLRAEGE